MYSNKLSEFLNFFRAKDLTDKSEFISVSESASSLTRGDGVFIQEQNHPNGHFDD